MKFLYAITRAVKSSCMLRGLLAALLFVGILATPALAQAYELTVSCKIDNYNELSDEAKQRLRTSTISYKLIFFSAETYADHNFGGLIPAGIRSNDIQLRHDQSITLSGGNKRKFYCMPSASTDGHISFSSLEFGKGTRQYGFPMGGIGFNLPGYGEFTEGAGQVVLHLRYNEKLGPVKIPKPDIPINTVKQVDYLGDGIANPDTTRKGFNDYRTYLSAQAVNNTPFPVYKRKNFIIVADCSGSMNGSYKQGRGSKISSLRKNLKDLVRKLGKFDKNNRFTLLQYSNTVTSFVRWGNAQATIAAIDDLYARGGTNTGAALWDAQNFVVPDPNVENVLLMVTDGEPTEVPSNLFNGTRYGGKEASTEAVFPATMMVCQRLRGIDRMYSIFIGSGRGQSMVQSMTHWVPTKNEKAAFAVNSDAEMKNMFDSLTLRLKNPAVHISISCTLSEYVNLYANSFKLVSYDKNGAVKELEKDRDYTVSYDTKTRTVTATITKQVTEETKYMFSFDERANTHAIKKWLATDETYPHKGDPNTDYDPAHATSSGRPGFHDIDSAHVQAKYVMQDASTLGDTFYYPKPVVQVYFKPVNKGKVSAHVTLYNMLLSPNMFMFDLLDDKGNVIDTAGNDFDGNAYFKDISFKREGTFNYSIRPYVPKLGQAGFIDNMRFDDHTVQLSVTTEVKNDDFDISVRYKPDNRFHESYGLKGVVN